MLSPLLVTCSSHVQNTQAFQRTATVHQPSCDSGYLNGEIVLLGRLHGVPTPLNAGLLEKAGLLRAMRGPYVGVVAPSYRPLP